MRQKYEKKKKDIMKMKMIMVLLLVAQIGKESQMKKQIKNIFFTGKVE